MRRLLPGDRPLLSDWNHVDSAVLLLGALFVGAVVLFVAAVVRFLP